MGVQGGARQGPAGPITITPLTSDGGEKASPRLSPDGEKVAYEWRGDIYVKAIGPGTKPLRLTENAAREICPVWSPDGRQIAFVRLLEKGAAIFMVPSLGGQERKLTDIAGPVEGGYGMLLPALSVVAGWPVARVPRESRG